MAASSGKGRQGEARSGEVWRVAARCCESQRAAVMVGERRQGRRGLACGGEMLRVAASSGKGRREEARGSKGQQGISSISKWRQVAPRGGKWR